MRGIRFFLILLVLAASGNAFAEKRVALVIGNSAYLRAPELANPRNDASDMAAKLKGLGFEIVVGQDLDLTAMRRSVRDFIGKLEGADIALFFYAGHGLQVNGNNYMAPVDAQLRSYDDLDFEALPIELVLSAMERNALVNLVFLDACRDNPLAESLSRSMGTRSSAVGRGLAKLDTGVGSLIAFATQPGNVALDGQGRNSPFTSALLKHLGTPGQSLTDDLIQVRRAVLQATSGQQVPWDSSSLTGPVILQPGHSGRPDQQDANVPQDISPSGSDRTVELAFWESIKGERSRSYFESYVSRFPNGLFVDIAKLKIAELAPAEKPSDAAQPSATSQAKRELEASLGATDGQSLTKPGEVQAQPYYDPEKARRIAVSEIPSDADARLKAALKALYPYQYQVRYGFFRGNLYVAVLGLGGTDWEIARGLADAAGGHLVAISDAEENKFAYDLFSTDRRFVRVGPKGMDINGPWIGLFQPAGSKEPGGNWMWVTGEALRYKNWNGGQPNNYDGDDNAALFYSYGAREPKDEQRPIKWDDQPGQRLGTGFIIEVEGDADKRQAYLNFEIQTELVRLGCLVGKVDGKWGAGSTKALADFAYRRGVDLASRVPSNNALVSLRAARQPVCSR